jgi:hypothetical protein
MKNFRIEIKWAAIFIVLQLLWMLMEKLVGLHGTHIDKHALVTNFFAVPAILVYIFALIDKRKNYYGGAMSWKQGFSAGLFITAIVTLLSPVTQWIISTVITPEFFNNMIGYVVETGKMTQENAESYFTLKNYIVTGLLGTLVMGVVTAAVIAIFTKRKAA